MSNLYYYSIFTLAILLPIISLIIFVLKSYKVVKPDKIGIVSGAFQRTWDQTLGAYVYFRVHQPGSGIFVFPKINQYDELSTAPKEIEFTENMRTIEYFPYSITAVLSFNFNIENNLELMKGIHKFASKSDAEILKIMKPIFVSEFRGAIAKMKASDIHSAREHLRDSIYDHIQEHSNQFGLHILGIAIKSLKALDVDITKKPKNEVALKLIAKMKEVTRRENIKAANAEAEEIKEKEQIDADQITKLKEIEAQKAIDLAYTTGKESIDIANIKLAEDKAKQKREVERTEINAKAEVEKKRATVVAEEVQIKLDINKETNILINKTENKHKKTLVEEEAQRKITIEKEKTQRKITIEKEATRQETTIALEKANAEITINAFDNKEEIKSKEYETDKYLIIKEEDAKRTIALEQVKSVEESTIAQEEADSRMALHAIEHKKEIQLQEYMSSKGLISTKEEMERLFVKEEEQTRQDISLVKENADCEISVNKIENQTKIQLMTLDAEQNWMILQEKMERLSVKEQEQTRQDIALFKEKTKHAISMDEMIHQTEVRLSKFETEKEILQKYQERKRAELTEDEKTELLSQSVNKKITEGKEHLLKQQQKTEQQQLELKKIREISLKIPAAEANKIQSKIESETSLILVKSTQQEKEMHAEIKLIEELKQAEGIIALNNAKAEGVKAMNIANVAADIKVKKEMLSMFENKESMDKFLIFTNELITATPELIEALLGNNGKGISGIFGDNGIASIFDAIAKTFEGMTGHMKDINYTLIDRGSKSENGGSPLKDIANIAPEMLFDFITQLKTLGFGDLLKKIGVTNQILESIHPEKKPNTKDN